jgi:polyisoprenoid-binding protein YceI
MRLLPRLALLAALMAPALHGQAMTFSPDETHTVIGFRAATLLFKVDGSFRRWRAEVSGDPRTLDGAAVKITLYTGSVDTGNKGRDEHLRTADFFDAARHPRITFTSTRIARENGKVVVTGNLDMHGVTKELTIPFEPAFGRNGAGVDTWSFEGSVKLNRKDFGIGADSVAAKLSLKDEVDLNLLLVGFFHEKAAEAPAPKAKPAPKKKAA